MLLAKLKPMKSINFKNRFSIKSLFLVMILMASVFFGQCMMIVNTMAMDHHMAETSDMPGCDGLCNVEDTSNKEEFALFKSDPPEPKLALRIFASELVAFHLSSDHKQLYQFNYLPYLPPGTHSEGIRLRI